MILSTATFIVAMPETLHGGDSHSLRKATSKASA